MIRWLVANSRSFLWALALAVAVWISAVTAADPDETRAFGAPIPLEVIGQDPGLVVTGGIPREIQITLRAPRSIWSTLNADPDLIRAFLDLSELAAGAHLAPVQVQIGVRPVQIVSIAPQSIDFVLEPLGTRTLDVDLSLSGEAAVGFQIGETSLDPAQVVVAGAESRVDQVTRVRVSVNLNRDRETVDLVLDAEALDEAGLTVDDVTVSPDRVHVTIPVIQQGGYRDVAVKVVTSGRVAAGYRLTDISVFPPIVTVFAADPERVTSLPGVVETMPLELQNAQDDIVTRLALNLPEGISIVGEQTVQIQAGVSAIESSVSLSGEQVEITGLDTALAAQVSPETVDVIVSGPLPILDTISRQDVRVTVDLTGLAIGTHQVSPRVEVLVANVTVQSILPNTIEVVILPLDATGTPLP